MANFERDQQMRLNKISMERYKEQMARGFDIMTNEPLTDDGIATIVGEESKQQEEQAAAKT